MDKNEIYKKYSTITYRPSNNTLCLECSSILNYFILADIFRDTDKEKGIIDTLVIYFFSIINFCNTEDDFKEVDKFFSELSNLGGISKEFYDNYKKYINMQSKDIAVNIIDNYNKGNDVKIKTK